MGEEDPYTTPPDRSFTPVVNVAKRKADRSPEDPQYISSEEEVNKSGKTRRNKIVSRILSSSDDSDCGIVSVQENIGEGPKTRYRKSKEVIKSGVFSLKSPEDKEIRLALLDQNLVKRTNEELRNLGADFLIDIENARSKSTNLKGDLSGCIKKNVVKIRDLFDVLSYRLKNQGDTADLKAANIILTEQLKDAKVESKRLNRELNLLKDQMKVMQETIENLKEINKYSKFYGERVENRLKTAYREVESTSVAEPSVAGTDLESGTEFSSHTLKGVRTGEFPELPKPKRVQRLLSDKGVVLKPARPNKVRVVSDVSLSSPERKSVNEALRSGNRTDSSDKEWTTVVNNKSKKNKMGSSISKQVAGPFMSTTKDMVTPKTMTKNTTSNINSTNKNKIIRKAPRGSVVSITGMQDDFSYANALKKARENISLDHLGIERSRIRRAANGGLLIEITKV